MVTTFFGAHSFGGDAAYVDRLTRALCRRGHEVHVFHCVDAFNSVKGAHPLRQYTPPPGLHIHALESGYGILSPLATQATGRPYFKADALRKELDAVDTDVVHFHNISLVGGPGVLDMGAGAVKIMTAHEHWLICPMHLLWKYDSKACDGPTCIRCSLAGKRPPQVWRYNGTIDRALGRLDALVFPSRHTLDEHLNRDIRAARMVHLPYFLPDDWSQGIEDEEVAPTERPYLAAAGRLVTMKGFQRLIPVMKYLPEVDLRIAGTGPYEGALRRLAEGLPNVRFEGLLGGQGLARLFHGARAVVVPSLFPETFGYVVLEAFSVRTPVVVHKGGGAIHETGFLSGGGLGYETDAELLTSLRRIVHDTDLRDELADRGYALRTGEWSETAHLDRYFGLIQSIKSARAGTTPHRNVTRGGRPSGSLNLSRRDGSCECPPEDDATSPPMLRRLGDLWACLALLVLALACFARLVAQPGALIVDGRRPSIDYAMVNDPRGVGNDVTFLFLPHYQTITKQMDRTGRLPFWDTSGFAGRPMIGNPQGGLFYPPVWLAWACRSPAALGWLTVGHLLWAGIGTYVLARGLGMGRVAATLAGGCFEASPYILAQTFEGHYPHVWAAAWYPWAFWAFTEFKAGRLRGAFALPPILALIFLTGHPQEWYYLAFALSAWAVVDAARAVWLRKNRLAVSKLVAWGAVLALNFGLVALELIPDVAAQGRTLRSGRLTLGQASRYTPHSENVYQLLSPFALGGPADYLGRDNYWEQLLTMGLVPLVLALIAVTRHPNRGLVAGWLTLTVTATVFAAGRRMMLFTLFFTPWVPGINRFPGPLARCFPGVTSGLPCSAGLGSRGRSCGAESSPTSSAESCSSRTWHKYLLACALVTGLLAGACSVGQAFDLEASTTSMKARAKPRKNERETSGRRKPPHARNGQRAARPSSNGPRWTTRTTTARSSPPADCSRFPAPSTTPGSGSSWEGRLWP